MNALFNILVFPGVLFLIAFGLAAEYIDRKLYAKLQNRQGPPWFQPLADLIKLLGKEDVIPELADARMFTLMPIVALTCVITSFLYIPIWRSHALAGFDGDMIVVLYLLTIPTLTFFLAGWYSRSVFSMIGAARAIMQVFAYEVPLFLAIFAPAVIANTLSLSKLSAFYMARPWLALINIPAFVIAMVALMGKLERVPFDIPEAETEIVAGSFTEYSGRLLAIFRLTLDVELVVGASLLASVFFPFGLDIAAGTVAGAIISFVIYVAKVLVIVALVSLARSVMARLRLDQMLDLFWKLIAPAALGLILLSLGVKFWLNA